MPGTARDKDQCACLKSQYNARILLWISGYIREGHIPEIQAIKLDDLVLVLSSGFLNVKVCKEFDEWEARTRSHRMEFVVIMLRKKAKI